MNKVLFNVIMLISIAVTIISGISNYLKDGNYTWQMVSLIWMIVHYCAYCYINLLEKELDK
jgi:hypothetical protein